MGSLLPGLFWGAILFHIYDPWPFSLAQGPDTAYAQVGFRKVLGVAVNKDVEQIYYKGYEIRDYDRYLRFRSCAADVESLAISDLRKYESGEPSPLHLNLWLSWWFTAADASRFEHWANGFKEVWMGRGTCVFYVRNVDHVEAARLQIDMHQEAVSVALFAPGKMVRRTLCSGRGSISWACGLETPAANRGIAV